MNPLKKGVTGKSQSRDSHTIFLFERIDDISRFMLLQCLHKNQDLDVSRIRSFRAFSDDFFLHDDVGVHWPKLTMKARHRVENHRIHTSKDFENLLHGKQIREGRESREEKREDIIGW